ncbi:hypothetical protein PPYR_08700 [Photinus pyralis]|uniref:PX domain-containing protein n=1 Tax=Photinus pyralis TaxID=7054 RepID=A0A1Y1MZU8_PHOPY|nr:sorting nexin-21 [Photinus pyralis]KAB0797707.1 hypothetical protein PPYR_08700 [Photinus pyralis]
MLSSTASDPSTSKDKITPVFEITSAQIALTEGSDKKYVLYTLQIRHVGGIDDSKPAILERRYTDFYNLYTALKKDYPNEMTAVAFPKKVLTGNFDNNLISLRSTGFESLLRHVLIDSKLRASPALLSFLQDVDLQKIKELLQIKDYAAAAPLLENNFRLLNKVYTDRSPRVLLALCRLLGCLILVPGSPQAQKWADIALHRYEGVCDSDLLELYLPLLHVCAKIWWQTGRNGTFLESRLQSLKQQGIKFNEGTSLLDAVDSLEKRLSVS